MNVMKNQRPFWARYYKNPLYRGKHLIIVGEKVFVTTPGKKANDLFDRVAKRYPNEKLTLVTIPKADTLILVFL